MTKTVPADPYDCKAKGVRKRLNSDTCLLEDFNELLI